MAMSLVAVFRLLNELIFVLLGLLLVWVAATERYFLNRRGPAWIGLGVFLIYWGLRAWLRPRPAVLHASRREAAAAAVRGGSLGLVGLLMLAIAWLPYTWVTPLLAGAGAVLILRGTLGAVLITRSP